MKRRIRKKRKFTNRILKLFVLLVVPLSILLGVYTAYTNHIINERTRMANMYTLDLYSNEIYQDVESVNTFLNDMTSNGKEYQLLQTDISPVESQNYERQILDKYRGVLQTNKTVSGLFIFNPDKDCYGAAFKSNIGERVQIDLIYYFKELVEQPGFKENKMYVEKINNQYYLFYIKTENGVSCASVVSFSNIAKNSLVGRESYIFYGDTNRVIYHTNLPQEERNFVLQDTGQDILKTKDGIYQGVRKELGILDINVLYLVKTGRYLMLDMTQSLLLGMTILIILLIPFAYYSMKREFFVPMKSIVQFIDDIKPGNMELRMENDQRIIEFDQISESFNRMLDQIKQYKIESYEKELAVQKARLQYYQLQMRPHFFINCLKNLYALAEQKDYVRIQKMILAFSGYWRHVIQDSFQMIPLRREIDSVKDYFELMQMTMKYPPLAIIDIPNEMQEYMVPPMILLTFAENAVKHAADWEKQVQIHIKGMIIRNEKQYLNFSITDNGKGFSEESLKELNNPSEENLYGDKKIGISNVWNRLNVLYQGEAMISFSNNKSGAHIEIFVPIVYEDRINDNGIDNR